MFKKFKTPHGDAGAHLLRMCVIFILASLVDVFAQIGLSYNGGLVSSALTAVLVALTTLTGGIFCTMILRTIFGLHQTGRILQYAGFVLASGAAIKATTLFVSSLQVNNLWLSGAVITLIAFAIATLTGVMPWRKRTWLPLRRKKPKA